MLYWMTTRCIFTHLGNSTCMHQPCRRRTKCPEFHLRICLLVRDGPNRYNKPEGELTMNVWITMHGFSIAMQPWLQSYWHQIKAGCVLLRFSTPVHRHNMEWATKWWSGIQGVKLTRQIAVGSFNVKSDRISELYSCKAQIFFTLLYIYIYINIWKPKLS